MVQQVGEEMWGQVLGQGQGLGLWQGLGLGLWQGQGLGLGQGQVQEVTVVLIEPLPAGRQPVVSLSLYSLQHIPVPFNDIHCTGHILL